MIQTRAGTAHQYQTWWNMWIVPVFFLAALLGFAACETGTDSGGSKNSPLLPAPLVVQATPKDGGLLLQWTKVAPAQSIIPTYEVWGGTSATIKNAEKWKDVRPGDSQLVQADITGLVNDVPYYYWVKAIFGGLGEGTSPTGTGIPVPPPLRDIAALNDFRTSLRIYAGEGMLELHWDAADHAVNYEVFYKQNSSESTPPADAALLTIPTLGTVISSMQGGMTVISGLANNTPVKVWVRAANTAGVSGWAEGNETPQAAGSAPAAAPVIKTVTPGEGKLTLVWDQVQAVPSYKIFYNTQDNSGGAAEFGSLIPADSPEVRAELTGLVNDTRYYVWVQSHNSQGDSGFSQAAFGTPLAKPAIQWSKLNFELGTASAEFPFAHDLPDSAFWPGGRPYTDRLTRVRETALMNLFADGAAWYIRKTYPEENIDFVFINGGYVDNVLAKGPVTVGSLSSIVGSGNRNDKFFILDLTGAQLKQFFDEAALAPHTGRGSANTGFFGIVSKEVRYTLQYPKPPATGTAIPESELAYYYAARIKPGTLKVKRHNSNTYEDINEAETYRMVTTDYNASGVWYLVPALHGTNKRSIDTFFWRGVGEYIYDQGTVSPATDGRIGIEGGVPLSPPWTPGDWNPGFNNWPPAVQ